MDPEFPGRLDQFSLRFIQCMLIGNLLFGRNYFLTGSAPVILITDSGNFLFAFPRFAGDEHLVIDYSPVER